jgi:hypothetical protein
MYPPPHSWVLKNLSLSEAPPSILCACTHGSTPAPELIMCLYPWFHPCSWTQVPHTTESSSLSSHSTEVPSTTQVQIAGDEQHPPLITESVRSPPFQTWPLPVTFSTIIFIPHDPFPAASSLLCFLFSVVSRALLLPSSVPGKKSPWLHSWNVLRMVLFEYSPFIYIALLLHILLMYSTSNRFWYITFTPDSVWHLSPTSPPQCLLSPCLSSSTLSYSIISSLHLSLLAIPLPTPHIPFFLPCPTTWALRMVWPTCTYFVLQLPWELLVWFIQLSLLDALYVCHRSQVPLIGRVQNHVWKHLFLFHFEPISGQKWGIGLWVYTLPGVVGYTIDVWKSV